MTIALVDNGSLEPAAHLNLRRVAAAISDQVGLVVHAVSWRHSDRISPAKLNNVAGAVLTDWIATQTAGGEREFLFVPFFISAQGAIGSALRSELDQLREKNGGFAFRFADGLAARDALVPTLVDRIRETIAAKKLNPPAVIIVDHGGPSAASAMLRDEVAQRVGATLAKEIDRLGAASLEGGEFTHNRPLLADLLATREFARGDIVVAPLFLAPGRHAGPEGDIDAIVKAAQRRTPALRCHVTNLVGTHPRVVEVLARAVRDALSPSPPRSKPE